MVVAAPRSQSASLVHILPFFEPHKVSKQVPSDRFEAKTGLRNPIALDPLDEPIKALSAKPQSIPPIDLRGLYTREDGEGGGGGEGGGEEGGEEGGDEGSGSVGGTHGTGGDDNGDGSVDGEGGNDEPAPVNGPDGESEGGTSVYDDGCSGKCSPDDDDDGGVSGSTLGTNTSPAPWTYYPYPPIFWGWNSHPQPTIAPNSSSAGQAVGETAFTDGSNNGTQEYAIYGDGRSLNQVWPKIQSDCNAVPVASWEMIPNNTVQSYRNGTFAFLRENGSLPTINATFESCVNSSIGHNLPLRGAAAGMSSSPIALVVPLLAMAVLYRR